MNLLETIREHFGFDHDTTFKVDGNNIVAYCRRSEKDSKSRSQSVSVQEKAIKEWAEENGYKTKKVFRIDGESSKRGNKRPSIDALMNYCKDSNNKISKIVVFHSERFGRDGKYLTDILDQLIDLGIGFIDIGDAQDVFTPQGRLNQIMKFFEAEIDNEKRKKYVHANIQDNLLNGYRMAGTIRGYNMDKINGEQVITINDEGRLLKMAFEMKLKGATNREVMNNLEAMGMSISESSISSMFQNPFYCGLIRDVRNPAPKCISEGNHEPIVSMADFCRINNVINPNRTKKKVTDREELPLRRHLVCDGCGNNMTGEFKEKKGLGYYRCNKGCKVNKSAIELNEAYHELLKWFKIKKKCIPMLDTKLRAFYLILEHEELKHKKMLQKRVNQLIKKKDDVLDLVFAENDPEIRDEYKRVMKDLKHSIDDLEKTISKMNYEINHFEDEIYQAVKFGNQLDKIWFDSNLEMRLEIQNLLFPKGVFYDKMSNSLKPIEINPIVDVMGFLGRNGNDFGNNGTPKNPEDFFDLGRTYLSNLSNAHDKRVSGDLNDEVLTQNSDENSGVALYTTRSNNSDRYIPYSEWLMWLGEIRWFMINRYRSVS